MDWTNDFRGKTDFELVADKNGIGYYVTKRTSSQSYFAPMKGFVAPKWHGQFPISGASGMFASGYSISIHAPGIYKVTVTCSYPDDGVIEDEDGEEIPDDEDKPVDMGSGTKYKVKTSIRSSTTLEPILSCYKLRNTDGSSKYPENEMLVLAVYLSGGLALCDNGLYRQKSEPDDTVGHIKLPQNAVTPYILMGYKKVSQNNCVISKTYTSRGIDPSKVGRVGKIVSGSTIKAATTYEGYKIDYLASRYSARKIGNREYEITEEFTQSNPGGWSTDLYKNG